MKMQNPFDVKRGNGQPQTESGKPTVSESGIITPFRQKKLTPPASPNQKGFTHGEPGCCPVCGKAGDQYTLRNNITVVFCPVHRISMPIPPTSK